MKTTVRQGGCFLYDKGKFFPFIIKNGGKSANMGQAGNKICKLLGFGVLYKLASLYGAICSGTLYIEETRKSERGLK